MEGTLPRCRTEPHFPWISREFMSSEMACKPNAEPGWLERLFACVREKCLGEADILIENARGIISGEYVIGNIGNNGNGNLRRRFGYTLLAEKKWNP